MLTDDELDAFLYGADDLSHLTKPDENNDEINDEETGAEEEKPESEEEELVKLNLNL